MTTKPSRPRREYDGLPLRAEDLPPDGLAAARLWYEEALAWYAARSGPDEPGAVHGNEVALATATADGRPSVRFVLLGSFEPDGVLFYTDRESRKGGELRTNPHAAMTFWWPAFERQVRLEGVARPTDDATSDAYHDARPRGSRISATASRQSRPIESRDALEAARREVERRYPDGPVPRPARWGGFRLEPRRIELWQGRPDRLHDRLLYERRDDGTWTVTRLQP